MGEENCVRLPGQLLGRGYYVVLDIMENREFGLTNIFGRISQVVDQ